MSPKNRNWNKLPRETTGFSHPTVIARRPGWNAPADSWWTRPVQSRAEFDQLAEQRSRDAGWVGKPRQDPS